MRITFISPALSMGGGTKVISIYAKALEELGHNITIVSQPAIKASLISILKSLVKGKGWPKRKARCIYFDGMNLNHHVLNMNRPVIDSDVPDGDIVIATWWETAEWVNNLSDNKGAKVYFVQGYEAYDHLPVERCKATYTFPMHKIVIAKWLEKVMNEEYGDNNTDLVPNSVDHSQFFSSIRDKQAKPTVGFLYGKFATKGVDVTLAVIKILRKHFPELRIISFGAVLPPADNDEFDEQIEFHHLPEQIKIRDIYSQCDVWLTSSIIEGFNLPAMEAMACRTPVVSTKTGWPDEVIITGKNGALADVGDVHALAEATKKILSLSNKDWVKMSEHAYKTVETSSWEKSAILFENALKNACMRAQKKEISGFCTKIE